MHNLKKLIKKLREIDYLIVSGSTVVCALLSFIYSVYAKKYVDPLEYGIFSTCTLLQSYLGYAQMGVFSAYNRDYTQLLGANKENDANVLKNTTFTYIFIVYSVLAFGITIVFFPFSKILHLDGRYACGFILVGFILLFDNISNFSMYTSRMRGNYNYSAGAELIKSIVSIGIGLVLVYYIGYWALYFRLILFSIVGIFAYYKTGLQGISFGIDKRVLKRSVKTGLPLMVNSLIYTIMSSVDKFVILAFMDTSALGVYSVPILGFNTIVLIPQTIAQVFYYKTSTLYGESKNKKELIDICNRYSKILSLCTSTVVIIAYFALPIFVQFFMPKYGDGVRPAQILIIGVALYGATMLYCNIFSTLKWNKELIGTSIILCIFNAAFSTIFVLIKGRDIANVAYGTSVSYAIYSIIILIILAGKTGESLWKLIESSIIPLILTVLPALLLDSIISNQFIALFISLMIILAYTIILKPWKKEIYK